LCNGCGHAVSNCPLVPTLETFAKTTALLTEAWAMKKKKLGIVLPEEEEEEVEM